MYSTPQLCKYSIGQGEEKGKADNARSTTGTTYNLSERGGEMEENDACKIDMHKVFNAIAQIIGAREHANIKVVDVRKRENNTKEGSA